MTERPTFDWVREELEDRRSILSKLHSAQARDERWLDAGTSEEASAAVRGELHGLPANYPAKIPPLAYEGVMVGVNQVHVGESIEPSWHIAQDEENPKYDDRTLRARERLMTRWFKALVYNLDTYSVNNVTRELVTKLIGIGTGCITYSVAHDRWMPAPFGYIGKGLKRRPLKPRVNQPDDRKKYNEWERQRGRAFPFNIENVHPKALFFDPHHAVPEDFIREDFISKRTNRVTGAAPAKVRAEFEKRQAIGQPDAQRITYVSPEWIGQWVDGEPVFDGEGVVDGVKANPTGLPLHRMAFSGFGSDVFSGDFSSKGKGIIRDGLHLIIMKIVILNKLERLQGLTAFPPLVVNGPDKAIRDQIAANVTYGIGEIIGLPTGYSIQPFPELRIPAVVFQEQSVVDALLETHFGPQILRGQGSPQETAQGQRSRFSIATSIYRAPQQAAQQLMAAVLMDLAYLVKYELMEQCPVTAGDGTVVSIGPDDIDDGGRCVVDFSPPTEEDKAARDEGIMRQLSIGLMTPEQALFQMGVENAKARIRAVRVQKLIDVQLGSDAVAAVVNARTMEGLGIPDQGVGATPGVAATPSGEPGTGGAAPATPAPEGQFPAQIPVQAPMMPAPV